MKSIQEKRIENELNALEKNNSLIPTIVTKPHKDEYYINITIPPSLLSNTDITSSLYFLLHIQKNFPFTPPRLYCRTPFSYPSLSDGRNILDEVISAQWDNQYKLTEIVNSIPKFIIDYYNAIKLKTINLVGSYYLDAKYDIDLIGSLPVYFEKVKEKIIMNGKETEVSRYIMISDIFFLLFDYDIIWNRNSMTLVFWSNLRSLMTMRKIIQGDTCEFIWRIKNEKSYTMKIKSEENIQKITELVMKNLKQFGISYNVTKTVNGPKQGIIPAIDIEMVERQVVEVEERINEEKNCEELLFLMTLYEKAIEYYSATNNPRYNVFTKKIQDVMAQPEYNKLLEIQQDNEKRNEKEGTALLHEKKIIEKGMEIPSTSLPGADPEQQSIGESDIKSNDENNTIKLLPEKAQLQDNIAQVEVKQKEEQSTQKQQQPSTATVKINIKNEDLDLDFDEDDS